MNVQSPSLPGLSCGDFWLRAQDGSLLCARTDEYPKEIPQMSEVVVFNRGEKFESTAPDGTVGLEWTSKYGFAGMNVFHLDAVDEGLNEAGLSFGVLTLKETMYQTVSEDQKPRALAMMDVGKWILSSFATVAEVKEAIQNVRIWGQFIKPIQQVPGLHMALHDDQGNNGVIELINGEINFYDNPQGVLTNDPQLPWQLKNLEQYQYLMPNQGTQDDAKSGLPGGWSPVDRFVRLSLMTQYAKPKDATECFEALTHILNATDIPSGVVLVELAGQKFHEMTVWGSIKDLKNRIFYFRPQGDMTFRSVCLKNLPLEPGTKHIKVSVDATKPTIIDITKQLSPDSNVKPWGYGFSWLTSPFGTEVKAPAVEAVNRV